MERPSRALVAKATKASLNGEETARAKHLTRIWQHRIPFWLRFFAEQEKTFAAKSMVALRVGELRESEGYRMPSNDGPGCGRNLHAGSSRQVHGTVVTSGARKAYSTAISEAELNRKIFDFRQQLQNPGSNPLPLRNELYKICSPKGFERTLTASALRQLCGPSIAQSDMCLLLPCTTDSSTWSSDFVIRSSTPASLTRLTEVPQKLWTGVGFGVSEAKGEFSALPAVPDELRRIFRLGETGMRRCKAECDWIRNFTRDAFSAAMRQPEKSVVHIATHFDSRPGVASNSHYFCDGTR